MGENQSVTVVGMRSLWLTRGPLQVEKSSSVSTSVLMPKYAITPHLRCKLAATGPDHADHAPRCP
eukprot:3602760-Rhodomonas_salina.2